MNAYLDSVEVRIQHQSNFRWNTIEYCLSKAPLCVLESFRHAKLATSEPPDDVVDSATPHAERKVRREFPIDNPRYLAILLNQDVYLVEVGV
ncbi:hypothetical protein IFR05_005583 [Cadophora sp. M221]|nr:hypothetical protein IFR05_005583 [Cadophora sp. M221]